MKSGSCVGFVAILFSFTLASQTPQRHAGAIEFFGYKGIDLAPIRSALPVHEGDEFPGNRSFPDWKQAIRESVKQAIHREATDVGIVCCDHPRGDYMIYIGIPGSSSTHIEFNAAPNGEIRLSDEALKLEEEYEAALRAAVMAGGTKEDDSQGYALAADPTERAKQLAIREYALQNEELLMKVLESSSDARHRAVAAVEVGYGQQSNRQIAVLVKASLDADDQVRNNAIRALGVLASAKPHWARQIPPGIFIEFLTSGSWTDRNKGMFVLNSLTKSRDPDLLKKMHLKAGDALIEMARWKTSHALFYRILLGRIAGIEEARLSEMAKDDSQVERIVGAVSSAQ